MDREVVSVVIPSYKREVKYIKRAVNSILNQTYKYVEIIIVDDNENDNIYSDDIKKYCKKIGIKYIKQDGNKGACEARNLGIKNSTGKFLGFLDDDDEWLPTKIEESINYFSDNTIGIVSTPGYIYVEDDTGNIVSKKEYNYNQKNKTILTFHDFLEKDYIGSTSQAIIRKECFDTCGCFDKTMPARQDYEMWIRISKKYNVYFLNKKLFIHYMHNGEQISKNPSKSVKGFKLIMDKYKEDYNKNINAFIKMNKRLYKSAFKAKNVRIILYCIFNFVKHPIITIKNI